ncbi:MAG: ABC transporter ATP-binding protein [Flexilinea sp.]|nr:ABC transporter ATP-binding protein [Flexilinea sp.]
MSLNAKSVQKDFPRAGKNSNVFTAVHPIDFNLQPGKIIEITGRSGSGKSTLLNMLSGILKPTSGQVLLDGTDLYTLDDNELSRLRNKNIGLIPQGHTALLGLSILENVMLPAILYSSSPAPRDRAMELLTQVRLEEMANEKPNELSGGELRRMAVARALLMSSQYILADEPTAGLDEENILSVMNLLRKTADNGSAVLLVTHEQEAARFADEILTMDGGRFI